MLSSRVALARTTLKLAGVFSPRKDAKVQDANVDDAIVERWAMKVVWYREIAMQIKQTPKYIYNLKKISLECHLDRH